MPIKILPPTLRDQIAAGEVVERPASVIKELVENALDAGATEIVIKVGKGGRDLIEVSDNGSGMSPQDLSQSVLRHATSKLSSTEDLFAISQFGFRGEALAAMAAVSDLTITSKPRQASEAKELKVQAGRSLPLTPTPGNPGTTVRIERLFYPTPARLEYLKTPATEYRHMVKELQSFALAAPSVSFKVYKDDQLSLNYQGCEELLRRVGQIVPGIPGTDWLEVEGNFNGLKVRGFISHPRAGVANRNQQYLLVNQRRIEDYKLSYAVREAYVQSVGLEKHLHPSFVLCLDLDPILVDVNVHPRKLEVKFAEPQEVFSALKSTVKNRLAQLAKNTKLGSQHEIQSPLGGARRAATKPSQASYFNQSLSGTPAFSFRAASENRDQKFSSPNILPLDKGGRGDFLKTNPLGSNPEGVPPLKKGNIPQQNFQSSGYKILGQIARKYLAVEVENGVYFFDQHALHERQRFQQFWEEWQRQKTQPQTRSLLVPQTLELTTENYLLTQENQTTFTQLGFALDFGVANQITIHQIPTLLEGHDLQNAIEKMIEHLDQACLGEDVLDLLMRKALEYKACRGSVMFGDALAPEEIEKLVADFDQTDWALLCPHGRPNHHFLSFEELDRQFHR